MPRQPLFRRHDAASRTKYEELKQLARSQGRILSGTPGTLKQRVQSGKRYWVREHIRVDGRKVDEYLGAEGSFDARRIAGLRSEVELAKASAFGVVQAARGRDIGRRLARSGPAYRASRTRKRARRLCAGGSAARFPHPRTSRRGGVEPKPSYPGEVAFAGALRAAQALLIAIESRRPRQGRQGPGSGRHAGSGAGRGDTGQTARAVSRAFRGRAEQALRSIGAK